eukprot:Opistho-2@15701
MGNCCGREAEDGGDANTVPAAPTERTHLLTDPVRNSTNVSIAGGAGRPRTNSKRGNGLSQSVGSTAYSLSRTQEEDVMSSILHGTSKTMIDVFRTSASLKKKDYADRSRVYGKIVAETHTASSASVTVFGLPQQSASAEPISFLARPVAKEDLQLIFEAAAGASEGATGIAVVPTEAFVVNFSV